MSKDTEFTHVGAEANKIISRILAQYSKGDLEIQNYTTKVSDLCNDNEQAYDWRKAEQLNLFDYAVGS